MNNALYPLLETLDFNPGDKLLETILDRLGSSGTLVLPSFAWRLDPAQRPCKGYKDYFDNRPVFDVAYTAANIGWIPELFRQIPGVKRSLNFWWSICAKGRLADELTQRQEHIEYYYRPGSSFDLLRFYGIKILGLGVSMNTNSLPLIPDCGMSYFQDVSSHPCCPALPVDSRIFLQSHSQDQHIASTLLLSYRGIEMKSLLENFKEASYIYS